VAALAKMGDRLRDAGVRSRLLPYRRRWVLSDADWDREYGRGVLDVYGATRELARYSVLIGYLRSRPSPPVVLDVGCGVGLLARRLGGEDIAAYVGIDPSEVAIEEARRAHDRPDVTFLVGTEPSEDLGTFDVVVCNEVLYYVDDVDALMRQVHAVLRPGGWLLTSILRHSGDVALHRSLDHHFERVDAVTVQSHEGPGSAWRLACHARR
jgi:2-polyprenyl-3-methyl-5-hydroxy-6-metoxy-1,4-benzoquinol methylase